MHVPFCSSICPFCPYNKVLARDDLAAAYFAALAQETAWYSAALGRAGHEAFTSLYIVVSLTWVALIWLSVIRQFDQVIIAAHSDQALALLFGNHGGLALDGFKSFLTDETCHQRRVGVAYGG